MPCQHQWCSNMPSLKGNHGAWCAIGLLICSAYFTMCSSTRLLTAVAGSTGALVSWWHSEIVRGMNKSWPGSTLRGVPKNTSARRPGLRMGDASIFRGDRTSKFCTWGCATVCRLAGMKLDKGNLQAGEPPEAKGGKRIHYLCAGPF